MIINKLENTQQFIQQYLEKGGTSEAADEILSHLLELAVVMYQKGDIKTVTQTNKVELVCQLKKGSRRLLLAD